MKRHLHNSFRALFLSIAVLLSLPMLAVEVEIDGINYDLVVKAKEATVIAKISGEYYGKVVIPESVEHEGTAYSVTSIGEEAFGSCSGLTSITIGNSVKSIGYAAFYNCSGLTSVTIGNSVTSIGREAFRYCSGLTSVTIPNSMTSIGYYAFYECSGLTSVTIPNSVTSIGESAFSNCSGLTSVTIPNSVTSIGNYAFYRCSGLTSVTIGNSVTSIGEKAFYECSGLTSVTIPNSVKSIGYGAFMDCSGLTSVTIGNSVESIGRSAFFYCSGLTSVTIPNSVESIGPQTFEGCSGLTSVTIPNSVTSIEYRAFYECSGLTSVTIGNSVTSIGSSAFFDCPELLDVYCYAEKVPSTHSSAFNGSYPEYVTLHVPAASIENYKSTEPWSGFGTIKTLSSFSGEVEIDGINYVLNGETKQATVIKKSSGSYSGEVVIPESVEHEGTIYSVTSMRDDAFRGCKSLTSVTIGNSVTSIGEDAFENCSGLTSVTIGNSVTSIGESAFSDCYRLTSVHIYDIAAWCNIEFGGDPFSYAHHLYLNGEEVKDLVIPNGVTSIGDYAFSYCYGLTSVTIPNSVTSIGSSAFRFCSGLTSVTIPNSVTSIGGGAFFYCSGLTSVTIPNSVTSIGQSAFHGCSGLTSVTIPNSVTSIWRYAFYNCSGLTSVTIPNSVTSIGDEAFWGCSGLTSVTIPNSVTSIGKSAFEDCDGLTSVTIGSGVKYIHKLAFAKCTELLDVYCYAEKVPSTESDAFDGSNYSNATLHVHDGSIDSYKAEIPWSSFGKIMGLSGEQPEVEKCATPVVSYADGKLSMSCETEGAEFITKVMSDDVTTYYDAEIEFSATYNIEVYASKANFENSDTVSVALVWVENGDVSEETGVISVEAAPVLIQGNGGVLNISGVAKDTEIVVYTVSGTEVARATATEGTTTINTALQSGTIVVVKFGNKSVKIKI